MKNQVSRMALLLSFVSITAFSCDSPRKSKPVEDINTSSELQITRSQSPTHYKFYIESSASVRGFFKGTSGAKVILTQLTDRLDENFIEGDTISYNFISDKIQPYSKNRDQFLKDTYNKCNAAYSELDDNLNMVMDNIDENSVGLLISDYCFDSKDGNWATAQSGITNLFTRRLNENFDLTIAILKYNVDFDGRYFPGGIKCKKTLPIYVWAFGSSESIKRIVNLKVNNDGVLVFQAFSHLRPKVTYVSDKPAKGRYMEKDAVVVREWEENRKGFYSLKFEINVTPLALSEILLKDISTYSVTERYQIEEIDYKDGICSIVISTERPSPGTIAVEYPYQLPQWVENSNFEGSGLPDDGSTLGFKYLVQGVFDAYNNKYENYFSTSITLK